MTDLKEGGHKWDANQSRAARLALFRQLCGMSGREAADLIGIKEPNYYRKEMGKTIVRESEVRIIEKKFIEWRIKEIELLQSRIEYLNLIK
jgi:DNA-binding XRE family transcriptional regulator